MKIHDSFNTPTRRSRRSVLVATFAVVLATTTLASCGTSETTASTKRTTTTSSIPTSSAVKPKRTPAATIEIRVTDHSFDVSGPLRPGGTISVANVGNETHFMQVRQVKAGETFLAAKNAIQSQDALDKIAPEIGAPSVIVTPGNTVEITNPTLVAAEYLLLDWLSVEGDTTGAYHVDKGLVGHLTVAGAAAPALKPTATYQIAAGQAITGPSGLKAGHNVFELQFGGDAINVFPTLFRIRPGQTVEGAVKLLADTFSADKWPVGVGRKLASSTLASAYGPLGGQSLGMGFDLDPGTYVLAATTYDNNGAPVLNASRITLTVD